MSPNHQRDEILNQLNSGSFNFEELSLAIFDYQNKHNRLYSQFVELMIGNKAVKCIDEIPFLPIQFFKSHPLKTGEDWDAERVYESSGTTGSITSKHHVRSQELYLENSLKIFESQYGSIKSFQVLALLPSYLERENSSLVSMVNYFMTRSGHGDNGFYLHNYDELNQALKKANDQDQQVLLIGVSFALMDYPDVNKELFRNCIIVETGGMKGKKKELTRRALHQYLGEKFGKKSIHSEYGMTELLSQAWSKGQGIFSLSDTMEIRLRELTDPLTFVGQNKTGVLNIIDLLNVDSCAFIATDDLGRRLSEDTFEILGRVDGSDIRGCNLMYL